MNPRRLILLLIVMLVSAISFSAAQDSEPTPIPDDERFVGRVAAPPFPPNLDWINVDAPLTLDGLRGKIVLLDFWTYGCINCIHMIPVLERLKDKYADEIVIIGVHSAKFENEGQTENIRQIVRRYNLDHPVINDSDFRVWRTYGARAWPTLAAIDPRGNVVAIQAGEIPFEALDSYLGAMIDYYDSLGTAEIDRTPLALALEGAGDPGTPLLFPGKVLADAAGERLFIADSNHHRLVIADLNTYEVLEVIGTGERGFDDGAYDVATFNQPQGMTLSADGHTLYVADTNNHALRAVDLNARDVRTLAGTGEKGRGLPPFGTVVNDPLTLPLRSPWAVEMDDQGRLHIAMAGTHQLWRMDLAADTIQPSVGNGREAALNGVSLADAELAQPSGLYWTDGLLYFADSESSTIRVADFNADEVRLVSGTVENDLFVFGDIDGQLEMNLLQHPLGVVGDEAGTLYIADTYNNKIKRIDPDTLVTETLLGLSGNGGFRDGDAATAQFDEPGGLDYANGRLYVADTNNHAIRVIDLAAGRVSTVTFPNPEALALDYDVTIIGGNATSGATLTLDEQNIAPGAGEIVLNIDLPDGYKINDLIDSTFSLSATSDVIQPESDSMTLSAESVSVPALFSPGSGELTLNLTLYYCETINESLCFIDDVSLTAPVTVNADADASALTLTRNVTPPDVE